jgi:hypothetical protein
VSWAVFIIGTLFLLFGIVYVLPDGGMFGIFWVVVVAAFTIYYFANAISDQGLSLYTFDMDRGQGSGEDEPDFETKLRSLEALRQDGLISEEEYQEKRQEIMDQKW